MEIPSFILPANGVATPETVARKRRLAETLMGQGMDTSPVESPWQAVGRIGQAAIGGYTDYRAGQEEQAGQQTARDEMAKLLSGTPDNSAIMSAMNNPWITEGQGRMAAMLLEDNLKRAAPKDPIKVGEGDVLLDPNNGYQELFKGSPKTTDDIREYEYYRDQVTKAGGTPMSPAEFWQSMRRAGASQTNIDMKGQGKYAEERNKGYAQRANEIDNGEQAAMGAITSLGAMENAMNDPNFYSGFMGDQVQAAKRFAVALGADPNSVAANETFDSFAKRAALDSMGGSLGTGFSNADRDFVMGQVPTLANTPEGNRELIKIHRKIAQRKIEIARMMRAYEDANGQLDNGFLNQLSQWAEANPMFVQGQTQQSAPGAQPSTGNPQLRQKYGLE